jgi:hopanoid biosynthesis associated protein HpnK
MVRLIVHADDFGLSTKVNEGIVLAHHRGILTSTSMTACGVAFAQAVELSKATPTLDIGVHLTLVEERPVLDPARIPSLVGRDGRFHPHASVFFKKYLSGQIRLDEVRAELNAQAKKINACGVAISHLDSHQHLHILPGIVQIAAELAERYAVAAVRLPRERLPWWVQWHNPSLSRLAQMCVLNFFGWLGKRFIKRHPDYFFGFLAGGELHKRNLFRLLRALPAQGTCELMCHPGLHDHDTAYSHWNYHWQEELDALIDSEIVDFIHERRIQLISFRDFAGS